MTEVSRESAAKAAFKMSTAANRKERAVSVWGLHGPQEYKKIYGEPPALSESDGVSVLGKIFMDGKAKHRQPLVERTPRMILPGMSSFDPEVIEFQMALVDGLNAALKVGLDDKKMFTNNGVHASFDNILGVAGYMQNPMSAKPVDNTLLRRSLGLTDGYSKRQSEIASMLWKLVWSTAKPARVKVPKRSAGGMRRMSYDAQWKQDYARWKTDPRNYDRFLRMVEQADVYGLANEYEIVFGMVVQKRLQLDSINKVRLANDWQYALTGGEKGKRTPTDKSVVINGVRYERMSALRVRVIDAGPWAINCDLQMVASSHMRALFERFPSTFHINTKEEIKTVVDGKHVFCSDVSEYDQSMSRDAIAVVFKTMREYYPEGICRSAERLYEAPYFARPLSLEGTKGLWIKNPMDWSFSMNSGNRSGHAFTSLVAKVNKVAETLFLLDLIYPVNLTSIQSYLKGSMPIGVVNNGDDEIVWSHTESDMRRFVQLRGNVELGHYVVTPEVGQGFSGLLLVKPDPQKLVYEPTARLHTTFEKSYVPERSVGAVMREFYPLGWFDRIASLHESDAGREAWSIHNFYYRKHLETKYGSLTGILERALDRLPRLNYDLSSIEREVLADPDKLHYKYDDSVIRDEVLNSITANIPVEYVAGWLRRYYRGTLI